MKIKRPGGILNKYNKMGSGNLVKFIVEIKVTELCLSAYHCTLFSVDCLFSKFESLIWKGDNYRGEVFFLIFLILGRAVIIKCK